MCLYTADKTFNVTTKDIICYKIVDSLYRSIIQKYPYELNKLSKSKLGKMHCNRVEKGLHTFKYLREAKSYLERLNAPEPMHILKCIIPKNSQYFSGLFICGDRAFSSYVSDTLLPIKEIK